MFFFVCVCAFLPKFGGLEAIITAVMDEYPDTLSHRRELFVLGLVVVCFLGSLSTLTTVHKEEKICGFNYFLFIFFCKGGAYVVKLLEEFGVGSSIIAIVFLEATAVSWFYGKYIIISSLLNPQPLSLFDYKYPDWSMTVGYIIGASSFMWIPIYMVYKLVWTPGSLKQ
ncbi:hypothetical protein cypCar_00007940, partial [Cyprinus carpio]